MDTFNTTKELIMNTPVPVQTRTYKPVSHSSLIDLTLDSISKAGFTLDKETYSSAVDGQIANGRFSISNVADSEMQLQIGWQNSTTFGIAASGVAWRLTTASIPTLNTWSHIAAVRSGTGSNQTAIYINGAQVALGTVSDAFTTTTGENIGGASDSTAYYTGMISNLRIVKGQALYTANFTPATSSITTTSQGATLANVSLLTCQSKIGRAHV